MGSNGRVMTGGAIGGPVYGPMNVCINSLTSTSPPKLRIGAIQNAASVLDGPLSPGEAIMLGGAGFGSDSGLWHSAIMNVRQPGTVMCPERYPCAAAPRFLMLEQIQQEVKNDLFYQQNFVTVQVIGGVTGAEKGREPDGGGIAPHR
jgi:hypothetical protein